MTRRERLKQNRDRLKHLPIQTWLANNKNEIIFRENERTGHYPNGTKIHSDFHNSEWRIATEIEIKRIKPDEEIHP